jgi:hypothetical protein
MTEILEILTYIPLTFQIKLLFTLRLKLAFHTIHRPSCSFTGGISHVIKELACAMGK